MLVLLDRLELVVVRPSEGLEVLGQRTGVSPTEVEGVVALHPPPGVPAPGLLVVAVLVRWDPLLLRRAPMAVAEVGVGLALLVGPTAMLAQEARELLSCAGAKSKRVGYWQKGSPHPPSLCQLNLVLRSWF